MGGRGRPPRRWEGESGLFCLQVSLEEEGEGLAGLLPGGERVSARSRRLPRPPPRAFEGPPPPTHPGKLLAASLPPVPVASKISLPGQERDHSSYHPCSDTCPRPPRHGGSPFAVPGPRTEFESGGHMDPSDLCSCPCDAPNAFSRVADSPATWEAS